MRNTFRDPALQKELELNGYVKVDLLTADEVSDLKNLYDERLANTGNPAFAITSMFPDVESRLVVSDQIGQKFQKAVDTHLDNYQWYFGNYLIKHINEDPKQGYVTMHQDPSHLDEENFRSVTIWCPLCDTNKDNGGLYMVKGSHQLNKYPRGYGRYGAIHFLYPELQRHLMDNYLFFEPLKAGQALIFPATTFHFSEPNRTNVPRIVACGLLGPEEAQLQYYHQENDDVIEVFNVDPKYYLTAPIFSRPDESKYTKVREVTPGVDSLDQEKLDATLAPLLKDKRRVFRNPDYQNQFENDGYVVLDILNEEEIRTLLDIYSDIEENLSKMPFATSGMNSDNASKRKVSDVMKQVFADKIEEIFDDYKWFFGTFIYKYPSVKNGDGVVSLHQDATIVDESKYHGINIFCSLGSANEENGTLQVIPGSHKLNTHPRGFGQAFPYTDLEQTLFSHLKRIDLNPGQAIIYTTKIFHYSKPNISNSPRIIAAGIVGPRESKMRYCYIDREKEDKIEVFEVDSEYYLTAPFFSKPDASQYRLIEEIEIQFESLDADGIEKKLSLSKCN